RRHHSGADQPRAFFADALPALLFRLFVSSSPASPCFLDLAAGDAALADLIASLLAPSGPLLVAISAADRHSLARFTFPRERLPDWLGFALSSTAASSDKVLEVLGSSELLGLIYKVDAAYHSRVSDSQSCCLDDVLKYVPTIREQLQDWEDGLSKHSTDGSFLHMAKNSSLRLFSFDDDGAYNLLQLLLLRAETEIQRLPGDAMQTRHTLDVIKSNMRKVFYKHVESFQAKNLPEGEHKQHHGRGDLFVPKHPSPGKNKLADMKYSGDWMLRPISDTEVAWLARLLICFSAWLNETLRLVHADADAVPTGPTIIKIDQNEPSRVGGPKDAARMVLVGVFTLLTVAAQWILQFMRNHKIRINLRILASKKLLAVAAMLCMVYGIAKNMLS
uniref:Uncharacterized protein n=1 Tax=Aegilops tauschii subsp. strangulata TaxID=200361 RepID=A0A452YVZ9_AEGTS